MVELHQSRKRAKRSWLLMASFAVCMLMVSCSSSIENVILAKQAVEEFHTQMNTEQYKALYAAADDKFHQATGERDFTKLLQSVHRKLGNAQHSNLRYTNVGWYAGQGTTVTLTYETTFASGAGTEQFVWHMSGDRAMLYGYHITSNDLITQ
jgi:opacity protein-like surface antigen